MSILRTVSCNVCGASQIEEKPSMGWPGWGQLMGIGSGETENPHLCPECLTKVAALLGTLGGDS